MTFSPDPSGGRTDDDGRPRVLVTRPAADAAAFAERLAAAGYAPVQAPLLTIAPAAVDAADLAAAMDGVQAVLFTSANGVRAFAALRDERALPALCVGPATAEAAAAAGFADPVAAGGDVTALAETAAARLDPADGPLFHAAGSTLAGDLAGALEAAGFTVRRRALYRADTATTLPAAAREALATGDLAAVTLFSPRTAATLAGLIRDAGLAAACARVAAVCLSTNVADRIGELPWAEVRVAPAPDADSLIATLAEADTVRVQSRA